VRDCGSDLALAISANIGLKI